MKRHSRWRLRITFLGFKGFSLIEAMVAIAILAISLLGVGYALHVASQINTQNIQILHRTGDAQVKPGVRDAFNAMQSSVYGNLK
ncbi:MAG: type IV pilus modification PilV family protein [Desulfomonilaceae bacterium]